MPFKVCKFCGIKFFSRSRTRKHCSSSCRAEDIKRNREEFGQICWNCKNACGKCSWSLNFVPVDGWDAIPAIVKDSEGDIHTYEIKSCPQFIRG